MNKLFTMIIALISVSVLTAAVINVPEDAATIQAGMDVATDGDTVLVDRGTYVENIDFAGKNIVVMSLRGPVLTTIDGNQNGAVVLFVSQEEATAVLDGFTITNGTGYNSGEEIVGGGIACRDGSSPTMKNLIVTDNTALGSDDPAGGGMTISVGSNPSLENITISYNDSEWGGGLAIGHGSNPILRKVEIYENSATTTGGGVYVGDGSAPYFEDVYIHHNRAFYYGGGIFLNAGVSPIFNKITVRSNRSPSGGGGLITNDGSTPKIINSIFHGNIPDQILFNSDTQYDPDTLSVAYSTIQGGLAGIGTGDGLLNWLEGNSSDDPCFIGTGDELQAGSPCINTGMNQFTFEGETWIDLTANDYVDSAPDKGSYEEPLPPVVYYVPGNFNTIQAAIDASVDGDIVKVDVGTYVENISFKGKDITVESLGGPELTIIDGDQNGTTVLLVNGESEKAILNGFTITNGSGIVGETVNALGGGILVQYASSPMLKNLIVSNNSAVAGAVPGGAGGGIAISVYSNPVLENIIITENESVWGGGLSIAVYSSPIIRDVEIFNNDVSQGGAGVYIGIYASPYFESVYIHHNIALAGGGLFLHDHATPTFNKVTVKGNRGSNGGGGMLTNHASKAKIVNSIFHGNIPDQFYLMYFDVDNLPDTVSIAYSNIIGGVVGMHMGIGHVDWLEGNLSSNPDFSMDDHLSPGSPCIDAGTDFFAFEGETWVDMGTDEYVGDAPDMGSYEVPAPAILHVPADFASIQLGIEAAKDGDTVLVADGTYVENINFLGKNIAVKSMNGPEATIIDGGNANSTVIIMSQEETASLDGFTITNGMGWVNPDGYSVGGGINVRYASTPTLRNLIIESNACGSSTVLDTSMGGGIMCSFAANALIEDVIIRDNAADYAGGFMAFEANPILRRVKIHDNLARVTGGGLTLWTSEAQVEEVAIYQNEATYLGAGVWLHEGSDIILERVTVADNKVLSQSGDAGGIALSNGSNLNLRNSIVWGNTIRGITPNQIEFWSTGASNSITIMYSDVQGGADGINTNDNGTVTWAPNSIVADPLFVDPSDDDYNLQTGSPCIGAGLNDIDMGAGEVCMTLATDPDLVIIPQQFELYQNYPNPFNPSTTISFELPGAGWVNLVLYDVIGREVATLIDDQRLGGKYTVNWLASDQNGRSLGSGIYLYEMKFTDSNGEHFREVRKFTLLK